MKVKGYQINHFQSIKIKIDILKVYEPKSKVQWMLKYRVQYETKPEVHGPN